MEQQQKSTKGPPMWVESLLTTEEYRLCSLKYPNTYQSSSPIPRTHPKYKLYWRDGMGAYATTEEIENSIKLMAVLREFTKQQKKKEVVENV